MTYDQMITAISSALSDVTAITEVRFDRKIPGKLPAAIILLEKEKGVDPYQMGFRKWTYIFSLHIAALEDSTTESSFVSLISSVRVALWSRLKVKVSEAEYYFGVRESEPVRIAKMLIEEPI